MKQIGVASDHAGFDLTEYLVKMLLETGFELIDYGNKEMNPEEDYLIM